MSGAAVSCSNTPPAASSSIAKASWGALLPAAPPAARCSGGLGAPRPQPPQGQAGLRLPTVQARLTVGALRFGQLARQPVHLPLPVERLGGGGVIDRVRLTQPCPGR